MGSGIAQVAAQHGHTVLLNDRDAALIERGIGVIAKNLDRAVEKSRITQQERDRALAAIRPTPKLEGIEAEIAIEAATEHLPVKLAIFTALEANTPASTILASNTSSISITKLAAATSRPDRVIGMHFMNPPPVMKLVEIVRGVQTSAETLEVVKAIAQKMGKTTITSKDVPGFLVNRMLIPMLSEACFALQEGLGTPEDIDTGARLGLNHPMGPLELADLIGLDTMLFIAEVLHREFGDDKYRPPTLLRNLVAAGWFGKKSGRGFYVYDEKGNRTGRAV